MKKKMVVKFKKLVENAKDPVRANTTDAGWDLTATNYEHDPENQVTTYHTGIAVAIPEGYVGLLFPRSSIYKQNAMFSNSVGVIDAGYRGEIKLKLREYDKNHTISYVVGDRVGQLIIMPIADVFWSETKELPPSERGEGGYGSSDLQERLNKPKV